MSGWYPRVGSGGSFELKSDSEAFESWDWDADGDANGEGGGDDAGENSLRR